MATSVTGSLRYPALTQVVSSESAAVFLVQARKLRAFLALARRPVGYELAMYMALRVAIYHFRFDYSRTQVI